MKGKLMFSFSNNKLKFNVFPNDIILKENYKGFKKHMIYSPVINREGGIILNEVEIPKSKCIFLNEKFTSQEEKEIVEIINKQIKQVLWHLYTKSSVFIK